MYDRASQPYTTYTLFISQSSTCLLALAYQSWIETGPNTNASPAFTSLSITDSSANPQAEAGKANWQNTSFAQNCFMQDFAHSTVDLEEHSKQLENQFHAHTTNDAIQLVFLAEPEPITPDVSGVCETLLEPTTIQQSTTLFLSNQLKEKHIRNVSFKDDIVNQKITLKTFYHEKFAHHRLNLILVICAGTA